jgi:hypothetical protein
MSHVMPEADGQILRRCCSLGEVDVLPEKLEEEYWELKRCCDRIGVIPSHRELAMLGFLQGYGKPTKKELAPPSIVDLWKAKKVKHGDEVKVEWRNGIKPATLKGVVDREKVIVQFEGEGTEKTVPADKVSVAA